MNRRRCCGNCKHFKNEDAEGKGVCANSYTGDDFFVCCGDLPCKRHEWRNNGWTKITPGDVGFLRNIDTKRLIIAFEQCGTIQYQRKFDVIPTLEAMSECDNFYYFIIPELNIL